MVKRLKPLVKRENNDSSGISGVLSNGICFTNPSPHAQLPGAVKKSKKGTFKTLSPVPTQRAASAEADYKAPLLAIPQIILKVMEGDGESTTELLCSTLPPPDEVLQFHLACWSHSFFS